MLGAPAMDKWSHAVACKLVCSSRHTPRELSLRLIEQAMFTSMFREREFNPLQTKRKLLHLKTQIVPCSKHFSSRLTKSKLFHLKTQIVPCSKHFSSRLTKSKLFHLKTQFVPRSKHFSSRLTKRKLFHLMTQFVPRSKHFSSGLKKQINLCYIRQKSLFAVI
jgi:hypothetical protein